MSFIQCPEDILFMRCRSACINTNHQAKELTVLPIRIFRIPRLSLNENFGWFSRIYMLPILS